MEEAGRPNLPLVDPFATPFEAWDTRPATLQEMMSNGGEKHVRTTLKATIADARAAALHMALVVEDNGLSAHVANALKDSPAYRSWQRAMPAATPTNIGRYQKEYATSDFDRTSEDIVQVGRLLSPGQRLFHGGSWPHANALVSTRPLSTSLCPQVALRNVEFNAKAYDAGHVDLLVLRVVNPATRAFVFKRKNTKLGHESEVLFASGATLQVFNRKLVRSDYPVAKWEHPNKAVPINVVEVDVS